MDYWINIDWWTNGLVDNYWWTNDVMECTTKLRSHVTHSSGKLALSSSRHKALCTIIIDVAIYPGSIMKRSI